MIKSECTDFIKNKLQWTYTIYFFIGVLCIGAVLNYKSPYNYFWVLYPFLLIMLASTLGILKYALRKLDGFKEENRNMAVERELAVLYPPKSSFIIAVGYTMLIGFYFISLYVLKFIEINLMGGFLFLLGAGTFLFGLISYEMYIRLTVALSKIAATEGIFDNYDSDIPFKTKWLEDLHHLSRIFRYASLGIGIEFVLENAMIYYAHKEGIEVYWAKDIIGDGRNVNFWEKVQLLPVEFWFIWIIIFLAIVVAFPLLAELHVNSFKKIISKIENDCKENLKKSSLPVGQAHNNFCSVSDRLKEIYLPRWKEKSIAMLSTIITLIINIAALVGLLY